MAWLLTLILGLPLLVQSATTHDSISTQPSDQNNLSSQGTNDFQQTLHVSPQESRTDNRLHRDFLLPHWPNFDIIEGSGEGSGLQQSIEVIMPSSGVLETDTFIPDRAEKLDLNIFQSSAPYVPQRLTQHFLNDDDDQHVILANTNSDLSTKPVQLTTHTHTPFINNNERMNKDQPLLTTTKSIRESDITVNSTPGNMYIQTFTTNFKLDHSTSVNDLEMNKREDEKTFQKTKYASFTKTLSSITKPEMLGHNGTLMMQSDFIQESFDNPTVKEELYGTNHAPTATPSFETDEQPTWLTSLFASLTQSISGTTGSCILGKCKVSRSNITRLQWDDLKRTLTFAWDLHVYGSATLFFLVVVVASFGAIGGAHMRHPFCEAFILANILLLLAGLLRFLQFIIDPYNTRNIMPRPALSALYNLPVTLLLWAQATLALFSVRQERLSPQNSPQKLSITAGGMAALHCTSILMADLLSNTLSPALPLMLQTLTICWGLPLCLGIFFQSLKKLSRSHRTPVPRCSASKRVVNSARRVLLLCGMLGVLTCALQIYCFLWLYGLLGDWRTFRWGWWVAQLWARLSELAWSFSLLLLGSRVFWRTQGRPQQSKMTNKREQKRKQTSQLDTLLDRFPMGPWSRPDRNWAKLLPNNWEGQKQSRGNVRRSMIRNQATPAISVTTVHDNNIVIDEGVFHKSSNDCHDTPLWTSGVEWQERECFLSLIEFDLSPPSSVNLSHSIDSALHHAGLLGVGTIFAPSSPSWNQNERQLVNIKSPTITTNRAYGWALDTCADPLSTQHFGTAIQQTQVSAIEPLLSLSPETIRIVWERDSAIPRVTTDDDLDSIASGDDVTSL
nr:uncharacterized protein LOC129427644 isoform X1 [Misgurnus anguillicaudatus]